MITPTSTSLHHPICRRRRPLAGGHAQHGLTLVEVMVAMFAAAVVLTLASQVFLHGWRGSERTKKRVAATQQVNTAITRLQTDLAAIGSRDRGSSRVVYQPSELATAIAAGTQLRGIDLDTGRLRVLDVRDISRATATSLTFQADVDGAQAGSNPECVQWTIGASSVHRAVYRWSAGCGAGARIIDEPLVALDEPVANATTGFSYDVLVSAPASRTCSRRTISGRALSASERDRVVAVRMDLAAMVKRSTATAATSGTSVRATTVELRTRLGRDYLDALGCQGR